MERVLPDEKVRKSMAALAVGLASDCDRPEADVSKIFREKLANARTLPFVAFVTYDGKWVAGFSGYKDKGAFLKVVAEVEKSPALQASPAVRKKLAGVLARAEKAAAKEDWRQVIKAADQAVRTTGRCPERDGIRDLRAKAAAWAGKQFDEALRLARSGGDLDAAGKLLQTVKSRFSGAPEAEEATWGMKALRVLERIRKIEATGGAATSMRERAAETYEGKRWAVLFGDDPGAG